MKKMTPYSVRMEVKKKEKIIQGKRRSYTDQIALVINFEDASEHLTSHNWSLFGGRNDVILPRKGTLNILRSKEGLNCVFEDVMSVWMIM